MQTTSLNYNILLINTRCFKLHGGSFKFQGSLSASSIFHLFHPLHQHKEALRVFSSQGVHSRQQIRPNNTQTQGIKLGIRATRRRRSKIQSKAIKASDHCHHRVLNNNTTLTSILNIANINKQACQ